MQSLSMRDSQWAGSYVPGEQASQVTTRDAKPVGKPLNITIVQCAVGDKAQSPLHRG